MTATSKIKDLVVDDSGVSRDLLTRVLGYDPCFEIVGYARNGAEAVAMLPDTKTRCRDDGHSHARPRRV